MWHLFEDGYYSRAAFDIGNTVVKSICHIYLVSEFVVKVMVELEMACKYCSLFLCEMV